MTGIDNRMHLAARIKGMAGFLACLLAVFSLGSVLGQTGPVLPPQAAQLINELTTLVVTNTAVETNLPPGRQFSPLVFTNRQNFAYPDRNALLADGWSFIATTPTYNINGVATNYHLRNTEITNRADGLLADYNQSAHPGYLNIPCDQGDLWTDSNNTRNFLSRDLSPNWTRINLAITFTPVPSRDYQQMHLTLYQDDDNYVQVGVAHNDTALASHFPPNTAANGFDVETVIWELHGYPDHHVHAYTPSDMLEFRLDRDPNTGYVQAWWSMDGVNFADVGEPNTTGAAYAQLVNPRLGIWTGGSPATNAGAATLVLRELYVVTSVPTVGFSYSLLNPPLGATIDTNGIITWTPTKAQGPGTNVLTTVVTDNGIPPLSATNSFTVVVAKVNTPPTLPAQPDRIVNLPNSLTVTNLATDTDIPVNPLSYQLTVAPTGASIDANGVINWSPGTDQQLTTNLFVTVVTDFDPQAINAQYLSATNSFTVVVLPPPWPVLPTQVARSVNELTTLVVTNTATDGSPMVPQIGTNTILFNYTDRAALVADGWSFIGTNPDGSARNTETTGGAGVVDYNQAAHPGFLNIPCDVGDLYGTGPSANNTRNSLFRNLPAGWQSVRLALTFAPVTANYQQAHLGLYQDDDNYMQMGVAYNDQDGNERFTMDLEIGGTPTTPAKAPTTSTNLCFRLDRSLTDSTVTCYYSFDGTNWTLLGATTVTFANPRLMIWTGGSDAAHADMAVMDLRRLDIVGGTTVPTVLSYTLINPPAGATIDGNGIITWQPGETNGPGSVVFTTVVTDNDLLPLLATNSFNVVVNEINTPPTLLSQPDRVLVGPQTLTVTNVATDTDIPTNTLTFSLNQALAGAVINAQGVITWTPSTAQVPSTNVFITVVTDYNPWAVNNQRMSATNTFTVVVNAVHNGPALLAQAGLTIAQYATLRVTNTASDSDLPVLGLGYSLANAPTGAAIDTNGVISWMPGPGQGHTTNTITTVVTDTGMPPLSATNSFTVAVNEINVAPVLSAQANRTLLGQQSLVVTNTASEPDMPPVTLAYQLAGPTGSVIDTNGVINWTPSVAQVPSTNVFTTVVTNSNPWAVNAQHLSATNTFTVVVSTSAIRNGPTLPVQTSLTIAQYTSLTLTNTAIDTAIPLPGLVYNLVGAPSGVTVNTNGVITWAPGAGQGHTTNTITTVVTDTGVPPLSATNSFTVVVNEINTPPVLPVQPNRTLAGTQTLTVTNTATDSDIPVNSLSYSFQFAPAGAFLNTNGVITWTPALAQVPSTNVFITVVTDYNPWAVNNQHLKATNSFTVTLVQPPTAPTIQSITMNNGKVVITWNSVVGWTYRLQYKVNWGQTNWLDLLPDMAAVANTMTATNASGSFPAQFFRVLLLP